MNGNLVMINRWQMLMALTLVVISILTLVSLLVVFERTSYQILVSLVSQEATPSEQRTIIRPEFEYASRSNNKTEIEVLVTAYSSEDPGVGNVAYSGIPVDRGVAAVDPDVIPIGSVIYVPDYGYAVAADTGGLIRGRRIDVYFPNRNEAIKWGVKELKVVIYGKEVRE